MWGKKREDLPSLVLVPRESEQQNGGRDSGPALGEKEALPSSPGGGITRLAPRFSCS